MATKSSCEVRECDKECLRELVNSQGETIEHLVMLVQSLAHQNKGRDDMIFRTARKLEQLATSQWKGSFR